MSYSTYQNQQDMLERIARLEQALALLITNTQTGIEDPTVRARLLAFTAQHTNPLLSEDA